MATKVTWPPIFLIVAFRLISIRRNVPSLLSFQEYLYTIQLFVLLIFL